MLDLRALRYFVVLAEELHFGRAARRLSISQSGLSRAIAALERSTACRLLTRKHHQLELTAAGGVLRAHSVRLLRDEALALRDLAVGRNREATNSLPELALTGARRFLTQDAREPDHLISAPPKSPNGPRDNSAGPGGMEIATARTRGVAPPPPVVLCAGFDASVGRRVATLLNASRAFWVVDDDVPREDVSAALHQYRPRAAVLACDSRDARRLREITAEHPSIGVVVLAPHLTSRRARAFIACGAAAALPYATEARVLVAATLLAALGLATQPRLQTGHTANLGCPLGLSSKETDVAGLLESHLTLKDIAEVLGVSHDTIKAQTQSIYRKLDVHTRDEFRLRLLAAARHAD